MRELCICIPTWNRVDMTLKSFSKVYDDPRVKNIVIVEDASPLHIYNELKDKTKSSP